MNHLPIVSASIFLAWCVGVQDEKPTASRVQSSKQESQRIQGSWQFQSVQKNGDKVPETELKDRTVIFGGDAFVVRHAGQLFHAGTQKLDPSKSPKTINAMIAQGDGKGDILLGIYELDGDTLKVCFDTEGQQRPSEFKSDAGSENLLVVYKRVRIGDEPKPTIAGEFTAIIPGQGGTEQTTDVEIEKRGDAYLVTWRRNDVVVSSGIGLRTGDILSVSWATQVQSGVAVYQIEKDRKLVGRYTTTGGIGLLAEETLIPKQKID